MARPGEQSGWTFVRRSLRFCLLRDAFQWVDYPIILSGRFYSSTSSCARIFHMSWRKMPSQVSTS
jgi:hypothetical protein